MSEDRELSLHTVRSTKPLEWVGLTVVKAWLAATRPGTRIEDVHNNRLWFDKGIDLVLEDGPRTETVDLKVDSYFGTDKSKRARGFYNLDSGVMLIETTSQLRYDRTSLGEHPDVPGWFVTSEADAIYYYYVAIETPPETLREILTRRRGLEAIGRGADLIDRELISRLEVERDELLSYPLATAREWFKAAPPEAFEGWAGAGNPGYVTVSKRLRREYFLRTEWGKSHGSIIGRAKEYVSGLSPKTV